MRRVLLAPAAILGQLNTGLKLLVFARIITDALADGAFHFDEILLAHRSQNNTLNDVFWQ